MHGVRDPRTPTASGTQHDEAVDEPEHEHGRERIRRMRGREGERGEQRRGG